MRYELTDFEWGAIRSFLPNKPHGVPRVDDFNKIKQCRRVATRYDKLAVNYLAFIKVPSIRIWLRANESTP
jgi:transposase